MFSKFEYKWISNVYGKVFEIVVRGVVMDEDVLIFSYWV